MANLTNFCEFYDMQMHKTHEEDIIASDIDRLLEDYLPRNYVEEVKDIADEKEISITTNNAYIRHVRIGYKKDANVFMCILEVAHKYKKAMEKLKETMDKVAI